MKKTSCNEKHGLLVHTPFSLMMFDDFPSYEPSWISLSLIMFFQQFSMIFLRFSESISHPAFETTTLLRRRADLRSCPNSGGRRKMDFYGWFHDNKLVCGWSFWISAHPFNRRYLHHLLNTSLAINQVVYHFFSPLYDTNNIVGYYTQSN